MNGDQPSPIIAYPMPPHRRLAAHVVTGRFGHGLAILLMVAWAVALYLRMRIAGRSQGAGT